MNLRRISREELAAMLGSDGQTCGPRLLPWYWKIDLETGARQKQSSKHIRSVLERAPKEIRILSDDDGVITRIQITIYNPNAGQVFCLMLARERYCYLGEPLPTVF